ncbi:MAG: hypothetical protein ACTHM0_09235 [Sphingomonas sp.]
MAEGDGDDRKEGWRVPVRIGAISGALVPIVLALIVLGCGVIYDHTLREKLIYTVTPQPAPGLEASIHSGGRDPEAAPPRAVPDPAIERAKREVAASGLSDWPAR